jgi:predicted DCC family thiol-disulfide oxidoreductase YuxK
MPQEACMTAMQLVLPDGQALPGERAIPEILKRLRGWRILSTLFRVPGTGFIARRVYAWVARNRYTISCALRRSPAGPPCP